MFVYNRPQHTRQTVEALLRNALAAKSDLYVFSDAPKDNVATAAVQEVRDFIRNITGFKSVTIIERESNLGLAASIIDGVTKLCKEYGLAIVLEDDLVVSQHFLEYMNQALARYANEEQVMQISGYMFPADLPEDDSAIFLAFTTSWGWATWQRAWQHFDPTASGYAELKKNRKLRRLFDLNDAYPYFEMLENQINGKIDSWAIRWYLSVFMRHGLTICPPRTMVQNIGIDGSGVNCGKNSFVQASVAENYQTIKFPDQIILSKSMASVVRALRLATKKPLKQKIKSMFR